MIINGWKEATGNAPQGVYTDNMVSFLFMPFYHNTFGGEPPQRKSLQTCSPGFFIFLFAAAFLFVFIEQSPKTWF
jgi:hypothetical protein